MYRGYGSSTSGGTYKDLGYNKSKYYRANNAGGENNHIRSNHRRRREKMREHVEQAAHEAPAKAGGCARLRACNSP